MDYRVFGERLLDTLDLDPLYVTLVEADLDPELLKRWLFAYWLFYQPGVVSIIATAPDPYKTMHQALPGERGTERRHFRGDKAVQALNSLELLGPPEEIVDWLIEVPTFSEISRRSQTLPQFGPWIAFKIADMVDRVMGIPVDFSGCYLGIYRDPVRGAALVTKGDQKAPMSKEEITEAYDTFEEEFCHRLAPPYFDRPVNIQETETIMCKYKSHYNGHYPIGKDTIEILKMLDQARGNVIADKLIHTMRSSVWLP